MKSSAINWSSLVLALQMLVPLSNASAEALPDIVWSTNTYILGRPVISVAFSGDGTMLASCLARTTSVWRVSDKTILHTFSMRSEATSVSLSPDLTMLGAGSGGSGVGIWRLSDGTRILGSFTEDSDDAPYAATFSPDSRLFATASIESGLAAGPVQPPGLGISCCSDVEGSFDARFSPDGATLAAGFSDNTAKLIRVSDGMRVRDLAGHSGKVTSVDFSPDGALLATAATDGDARLWRVSDGNLERIIRGGGGSEYIVLGTVPLGRARFSADGKSLLTLSNGAVRFWSVSDGRLLLTYTNLEAFCFAVSPDGKHFAYGTGSQYGTNAAVVLARMPLLFTDVSQADGKIILGWSGGAGRYQLQSTTNVATGPWQNVGAPTTAKGATNPVASTIFYRVQSLPDP